MRQTTNKSSLILVLFVFLLLFFVFSLFTTEPETTINKDITVVPQMKQVMPEEVLSGDYSSIIGEWENVNGDKINLELDEISNTPWILDNNILKVNRHNGERAGKFYLKGAHFSLGEYISDENKDRYITGGRGLTRAGIYYRPGQVPKE